MVYIMSHHSVVVVRLLPLLRGGGQRPGMTYFPKEPHWALIHEAAIARGSISGINDFTF